jgi:acetoin utilization protein AcuC
VRDHEAVVLKIEGPLLVFGRRSLDYDFGPRHPLSPRRFGPGIELLRAVGAVPGLAPELASDEELAWLHSAEYVATVRRFSQDPGRLPEAGIGPGDDPAFAGMHEAAASVAGGSIRAVEAILRGEVEHAYQPGGGLHHAMRSRASGFCVYNDVALAIARARRDGLRVLYVDLDVHHGDGVQALHYADSGVLTISFHESGRTLFPGTGFINELGEGTAAGTSVNVPLESGCGPDAWLAAVRAVVPSLAAAFGPDLIVSQHGADGHVWDPLAHLALTTTAMGEAARLVDRMAHLHAGGKWFATGGGGYSVYRVVPRVWALTWLAGAHREAPQLLPADWLSRWEGDAARWESASMPAAFEDPADPAADSPVSPAAGEQAKRTIELVTTVMVPALLRLAESRGWWRPDEGVADTAVRAAPAGEAPPDRRGEDVASPSDRGEATVRLLSARDLDRLSVAPRVMAPADPMVAAVMLRAALRDGAVAAGAVIGDRLISVALAAPDIDDPGSPVDQLVALGVAPEWRRRRVATATLRALIDDQDRRGRGLAWLHTVAERDPMDPLPRAVRRGVATALARSAGFVEHPAPERVTAVDPDARLYVREPRAR